MKETIERVRSWMERALGPSRFGHCSRTAELAESLCVRNGIDPGRGYLAGLSHDMCKHFPEHELLALASRRRVDASALLPKILHGPAAATLLAERFALEDDEILDAVDSHTMGRVGMGDLAMLVYAADKLEPGRAFPPEPGRSRVLALDPGRLMLETMRLAVAHLDSKGYAIHPETKLVLADLERRFLS